MKKLTVALIILSLMLLSIAGCEQKAEDTYYTVSFDTDGGTQIEPQRVKEGEAATQPENPSKNGYSFQGWLLGGVSYKFGEAVTKDITLVASYKSEITYSALIDLWRGKESSGGTEYTYSLSIDEGGSGSLTVSAGESTDTYNAVITLNNGRIALAFAGNLGNMGLEYLDGRLVGVGIHGAEISLDRQKMNTVTYHYYGGGTSIERYESGDFFRVLPCALPSGFSLDGWYTEDGKLLTEADSVTKNISVYANAYNSGMTFDGSAVTGYTGELDSVTIPTRFGGNSITEIGEGAFRNSKITSVTIPEGITSINDSAFYGCKALTSLKLPKSILTIGEYAFYDCILIPEINIPDGIKSIGFAAFGSTLGPVALDDGSTAIFSSNTTLRSISVPFIGGAAEGENTYLGYIFGAETYDTNRIDDDGFEYDIDGVKGTATIYYVLPVTLARVQVRNVTRVPDNAFYGCIYINEINLQGSVTEIGDSAFELCVNADVLGVSMVEKIGDKAFLNSAFDGSIFHVLSSIGDLAFAYSEITEFYLPSSIEHIGDAAFAYTELSEITFPASIKSIGDNAFWGCNSLSRATFLGSEVPIIGSDIFTVAEEDATYYTDIIIYVPGTEAAGQPFEAYRSDLYLRNYASGIYPESVRGKTGYILSGDRLIGYIAAEGEELTVINVPEGVRSIADFAFYNCGRITEINMPEGFERIGKYAFYGCTSVAYLNMPSTMKEIDDYAFTGFFVGNNITRLYFPEGFTRLGEGAFMSSFNLRIVELPSTLEYVGYLAFGMANSLERITFGGMTPPTVGKYVSESENVEEACEIFQIINTGKLTVFVPGAAASAYRSAEGFGNVSAYIKGKPDGIEVGTFGNGSYILELDGSGNATISRLVLADEDTSDMGGTRFVYEAIAGEYTIDGSLLTVHTEELGTLTGLYVHQLRKAMLVIDGVQQVFTEPKVYYDDYNWATVRLFEDGSGVFDMYGSFITPFKWQIDGDKFNFTIDGNNKLPENADYAGERLYVGEYNAATDSIKVSFMLNDYLTEIELDRTVILYATGEVTRVYGKYVAYLNGYAMMTLDSRGNGTCDFYIGENKYEDCTYTVNDGVVTVSITILSVELILDANGRLYGGASLSGMDMLFVYVDELMDSTKMPD